MDFGAAVKSMRKGKKMRRGTEEKGSFHGINFPAKRSPYFYIDTTEILTDKSDVVRGRFAWLPDSAERRATDWQQVRGEGNNRTCGL